MNTVYYEQKKTNLSCCRTEMLTDIPHFHSDIEMIVCFSGRANCFLNGQNFDFGEGDIVMVFPNQAHNYSMVENGEFMVVTFYPDLIPNMKNYFKHNLPERSKINMDESEHLKSLFYSLRDNYDKKAENSDSLLIGYLNMVMFYMRPLLGASPVSSVSMGNFEKICNYCMNNYRSKITLQILSKELHLSTQRISHIFNENMRITIPQYVNFLRVSEACRLLAETSDTVSKVSADIGFDSMRNFNRTFYEIMKMTPREFREKKNSKENENNVYI